MKIATWNLQGRWTPAHRALIDALDSDVLLLTEVSEKVELPGYHLHRTTGLMATKRRWAAVASRDALVALPDPHPASALAVVDGWTFCSSILPWTGANDPELWGPPNHAARTGRTVDALQPALSRPAHEGRLVWGGDWNHALQGREHAGSKAGRAHVLEAVAALGLVVPTTYLPHQIESLLSIDHVAVPAGASVLAATHHSTTYDGGRLSDHDAYVVEVGPRRPRTVES